jgi:hypothetical protein
MVRVCQSKTSVRRHSSSEGEQKKKGEKVFNTRHWTSKYFDEEQLLEKLDLQKR